MRIPHHLVRSASGLWSFRQRVPTDLQPVLARRILKRTLRTTVLPEARFRAAALAAGYARAFAVLRERQVAKLTKSEAEALIARLSGADNLRELTLQRSFGADGSVTEHWQIDNEADVHLFQQLERRRPSPAGPDPLAELATAPSPPPSAPRRRLTFDEPAVASIRLGEARDAWLASLKGATLPKTWTIKKTAIESLVQFFGEQAKLGTLGRTDLARWYQHMREAGASTPTLTNKQSYIGGKTGFFAWAMNSGYYPQGDNPASGHVTYSIREKRNRRKLGFKAFDAHQVGVLFSPVAFDTLSPPARWAALLGLYTGARASEVGQLLTSDIFQKDGVLCLQISDEGEHQKVKTEGSLRTLPLHPDLLELGFEQWVDGLRASGAERLFPHAKADAKNGAGNWITKSFSRHIETYGKPWPLGKRGFHSLRKTFIQTLQGAGVVSELRAQLAGHELDDEHHGVYSREFSVLEKLDGVGGYSPGIQSLNYGLSLSPLRELLASQPERRRRRKKGDR